MSGYVKELLLDYSLNRLHIDLRSDLSISIDKVFKSGLFTYRDLEMLNMYLSGYTAIEIAARYILLTEQIEITLDRIFLAIETHSGYNDNILINKVERDKQYRRSGIRELRDFLIAHGQNYITHEIRGINDNKTKV